MIQMKYLQFINIIKKELFLEKMQSFFITKFQHWQKNWWTFQKKLEI